VDTAGGPQGYACIPDVLTVVVRTPNSVSGNLNAMCAATLASFRKNRALLPANKRGGYWHAACAGALADYAKGAYRAGQRGQALVWLLASHAPLPAAARTPAVWLDAADAHWRQAVIPATYE